MSAEKLYRELQLAIAKSESPAPCEESPEYFFDEYASNNAEIETNKVNAIRAKMLCRGCLFKNMCAEYALEANEEFGVWGGLTPLDRRNLKRGR